MAKASTRDRVSISVRGVVQGVGFRPFIYQLATKYKLKGWVCNTSEDVKIEVEGDAAAIEQFLSGLREQAPPRASIESVKVKHHPPLNYQTFEIRHSVAETGKYQLISPDIATCPDCLKEIFSPGDRRYRYPFTNCTNCGPRFTIIEDIPYDRPLTTMRHFQMCPECQHEYDDPLNRRFHAQPNACPECGPALQLLDADGNQVSANDAITAASQLLREGKIVAIKGLGGFLLACDATSEATVNLLRQRKRRPAKPLAIMVSSIEEARKHCYVNEGEERLLTSPSSPIVLLRWKDNSSVSAGVAPGLKYLGVMLPYTPLHHLLLRETGLPLVMTSGNISEEPIAKDNDEAVRRLSGIADYFLVHNRDIYARYDDSVTMVERSVPQLLRRARSYAPYPIHLKFKSQQVLGCGAEEKNTFCLTRDEYAFLSQHIGDMENLETLEHFENTIALYQKLFRIEPTILAHDLHPEYLATKYAKELADKTSVRLVPVQHHHAHIVSGMVDNGVDSPVIGVAFDGTGYGTDGNIWGGEVLLADYRGFNRMGQLEYLPLPGGALAIKKPYRTAIGYIVSLLGKSALKPDLPFLKAIDKEEIDIIKKQIENKLNSPLTSSCGRLFDAVSALIGVRGEIGYEAQAAIELEMLAYEAENEKGDYPFSIVEQDGVSVVKLKDLFSAIIHDLRSGVAQASIAARFHNTMARMIPELCQVACGKTGIRQVVLSGGVFQNRLLLRKAVALLEAGGFTVFTHRQVPCNDGGISVGQAVVANFASSDS
ncbi:MAG: carbamoyltransferase HypF [Chloroflexi bacterium]|nr:carbamoyltransferase HypF [Chloroflexota bacterium]